MPFGAPFHTVPKSGWRPRSSPPQLASSVDDAGSTGSPDTSRFHGLSAGKGRRPPRLAFAPSGPELPPPPPPPPPSSGPPPPGPVTPEPPPEQAARMSAPAAQRRNERDLTNRFSGTWERTHPRTATGVPGDSITASRCGGEIYLFGPRMAARRFAAQSCVMPKLLPRTEGLITDCRASNGITSSKLNASHGVDGVSGVVLRGLRVSPSVEAGEPRNDDWSASVHDRRYLADELLALERVQHEVGEVGAGDLREPAALRGAGAGAVLPGEARVRQAPGLHDGPVEVALAHHRLGGLLVREDLLEQQGEEDAVVDHAELPLRLPDTERRHVQQPPHALRLHRLHDGAH